MAADTIVQIFCEKKNITLTIQDATGIIFRLYHALLFCPKKINCQNKFMLLPNYMPVLCEFSHKTGSYEVFSLSNLLKEGLL